MSFMTLYSKRVCLKKMQNSIPWMHILIKCAAHGNVSNYSSKIINRIFIHWRGHKFFYFNSKGVSDKKSGNHLLVVKNKDSHIGGTTKHSNKTCLHGAKHWNNLNYNMFVLFLYNCACGSSQNYYLFIPLPLLRKCSLLQVTWFFA